MTVAETDTNELIFCQQAKAIHKLYTHCTDAMSETHSTVNSAIKAVFFFFLSVLTSLN